MDINFTFSDTIAGYVTEFNAQERWFKLETSDKREYKVNITPSCYARTCRNLGEGWQSVDDMNKLLANEGQYLYAYGTFYPTTEGGHVFDVQWMVFPDREPGKFRHEEQNWWITQIASIANSYLHWQFNYPDEKIDWTNYRTFLHLAGAKKLDDMGLQETDTISRLVYGFASAYLLTGNESFLEAAETGTEYLREHMRFYDQDEDLIYWYHGIKLEGAKETKLLTSEFSDDFDSIPAYEQIYALAGPTQTYRITGDKRIRSDIDKTLDLFEKYYKDHEKAGYFSHLDPITLDPRAESLGQNRGRKNWNSVGDHAPAYLINLYLATGEKAHADFLEYTFDTITKYFPDYENSPFVQEKFHEDWSKDQKHGWQQNRGVVGHNLKIAWNLMRMQSLKTKNEYLEFARKIASIMPTVGYDAQRAGWYDVVERAVKPGGKHHQFVWHDRKAWWQQEQGILAYMILNGILKQPEYAKYARESAAFYSSFFLDNDDGAVYFNTLANGMPYLLGNERLKGSHSMSGYHSTELCYLAATYTNLLVTKQPMDMYFKPYPNSFKDNILRVSPDILPKGSVQISECFINDKPYHNFDAAGLTVKLPEAKTRIRVKVKLQPV